jgi:hypothetical protein
VGALICSIWVQPSQVLSENAVVRPGNPLATHRFDRTHPEEGRFQGSTLLHDEIWPDCREQKAQLYAADLLRSLFSKHAFASQLVTQLVSFNPEAHSW